MNVILVAIGGFFGAIARFAIGNLQKRYYKGDFPLATLFVNLLGAWLLGLLLGMNVQKDVYLLVGTGFMGAFTTFSTFKLESIRLLEDKKKVAIGYLFITYVLGISLAYSGFILGMKLQ